MIFKIKLFIARIEGPLPCLLALLIDCSYYEHLANRLSLDNFTSKYIKTDPFGQGQFLLGSFCLGCQSNYRIVRLFTALLKFSCYKQYHHKMHLLDHFNGTELDYTI